MPRIFVSYRREDTSSATGRLTDRLRERFGDDEVFRDLDTIDAGTEFSKAIVDSIREAKAVLVMVGREWLNSMRPDGVRRIDDPADYVRLEVELALESQVVLIPVLVEGASMPAPDQLPLSLRPFALRQAHEISEGRWAFDTDRLLGRLEKLGIDRAVPARITPAAPASFSPAGAVVHYISSLGALLVRPKTFLARNNRGRQVDFIQAWVFLSITIALFNSAFLLAAPRKEAFGLTLLASLFLCLLLYFLLSAPLYAAWRLAGATRGYYRVAVIWCYQAAVLFLTFFLYAMASLTIVGVLYPEMPNRVRDELAKPGDLQSRVDAALALWAQAMNREAGAAVGLLLIACLTFSVIWFLASWGAYRQVLTLTRWRSAQALALFVALAIAPVVALAWLLRPYFT